MARVKSEDKRNAILAAATRIIVLHGTGAPTAMIAQEAGVANGTLFTYFPTKAELFNHLYRQLKAELAERTLEGLPATAELRQRLFFAWANWMGWAVAHPEKRRAMAQLSQSEEITAASKEAGQKSMASISQLLAPIVRRGALRNAPAGFVAAILNSIAEATQEFMIEDPDNAKKHSKTGFEAFWRAVS